MSNFQENLNALKNTMENCEQAKGFSVYQHGISVSEFFKDLHSHVTQGTELKHTWKIPAWAKNKNLWNRNLPIEDILLYQVFHDCGKPYCRYFDENGKVHFPDHAKVSSDIWNSIGGKESIGRLISMDMDIHTIKAAEMDAFCRNVEAPTLLLTGLCEINSNANMFGGIDSISFKSKYKQIDRRGKLLIKLLNLEEM